MKNKNIFSKSSNVKTALLVVCVGILLLIGLEVAGVTNFRNNESVPVTPQSGLTEQQTKQQVTADLESKKQSLDQTSDTPAASTDKTIDVSARQEDNGTVTVFTKLAGYTTGNCDLKITNGSKTTQQVAEVIYQPEYSSCAGFSVPTAELSAGIWDINVAVTANGQSTNKTTMFRVQ